jgi:uncharacterized protein YecT (DUF1311 family)
MSRPARVRHLDDRFTLKNCLYVPCETFASFAVKSFRASALTENKDTQTGPSSTIKGLCCTAKSVHTARVVNFPEPFVLPHRPILFRHCLPASLILLATILPAAMAAAGEAAGRASFDCERAGSVDERLICSDSLLRQADRLLRQKFDQVLAGTGDRKRREAVRADQQAWIMRRNKECGISRTTPLTKTALPGLVDCFLDAYGERSGDLDRLAANKVIAPSDISAPIRKPLPVSDVAAPVLPPDILVATGLFLPAHMPPSLLWLSGEGLVVPGWTDADATPKIWLWHRDGPVRPLGEIEAAEQIDHLCNNGTLLVLARRITGESGGKLSFSTLPLEGGNSAGSLAMVGTSCNPSGRRLILRDYRSRWVLDLGPSVSAGAEPADRFITLRSGAELRQTDPPIRIDRRYFLAGSYSPFDDSFVVSAAERPTALQAATERRWAKANCLPFWEIGAGSGKAVQRCIPFGNYVDGIPEPLPSQAGLFFAVAEHGLFKADAGSARLIVAGPVTGAIVSADGCLIAYAAGNEATGSERPVMVLDVCRLPGKLMGRL